MKEAHIPDVDVVDVVFLKLFTQPWDQIQTLMFNVKDFPRNLPKDTKKEISADLYIYFNSPNYYNMLLTERRSFTSFKHTYICTNYFEFNIVYLFVFVYNYRCIIILIGFQWFILKLLFLIE